MQGGGCVGGSLGNRWLKGWRSPLLRHLNDINTPLYSHLIDIYSILKLIWLDVIRPRLPYNRRNGESPDGD